MGSPGLKFSGLPSIATHSYKSPVTARQAIESLLACSKCMPFILPICMARQEQLAIKNYDLLLQHAIRLLCGWLIRPSAKTRLSVFCERIFEHQDGDDGTDFIQGGWSVNPEPGVWDRIPEPWRFEPVAAALRTGPRRVCRHVRPCQPARVFPGLLVGVWGETG